MSVVVRTCDSGSNIRLYWTIDRHNLIDHEIPVVDDGSADRTLELVQRYAALEPR
jgi:glycosyltransferase involved in cell wall biosynthesis